LDYTSVYFCSVEQVAATVLAVLLYTSSVTSGQFTHSILHYHQCHREQLITSITDLL